MHSRSKHSGARSENDATVSFVLRALQLAFSAMAMVLFGGAFKAQHVTIRTAEGDSVSVTTYLGGPSANFILLVTFSASLYTLLWIVFVHLRRDVTLPLDIALLIDALFVVLTVSSGCAFLASDYLLHCELLDKSIRCGVIKIATAFVLVSFLFFLCSVGWTAYLRLEQKKKGTQTKDNFRPRPSPTSAIDMLPFGDDQREDSSDVGDYVAAGTRERGMP